jgi:hypothetical protein
VNRGTGTRANSHSHTHTRVIRLVIPEGSRFIGCINGTAWSGILDRDSVQQTETGAADAVVHVKLTQTPPKQNGQMIREPPSSAEVKNSWSYTSIIPIRLHGVMLS